MKSFNSLMILPSSSKTEQAPRKLEKSANRAHRFLSARIFSVSPSKSSLIVFTRKQIPHSFFISLHNAPINSMSIHKFWDIFLNCCFLGNKHISYISNKCPKLVNVIRALRSTWWGANPRLLLQIYKALIRRSMKYGCITFLFNNYTAMSKLNIVQSHSSVFTPTNGPSQCR